VRILVLLIHNCSWLEHILLEGQKIATIFTAIFQANCTHNIIFGGEKYISQSDVSVQNLMLVQIA